ncbi:EscU/YscU/HrcU family type III secretion system export apparatus switch protein [Robbsia sp. Bb-Pol-6]|uniref:EscU/YscU/HrcU family type III secretion system export apparatus switch protein n=1 Tax=Robbsia betulipollinis TaxID=2981849 RepID=A0ABT3ZL18_9BURK|nr:EscU/YscU/HrcU family type III secretion system export apparatus switch protein [Robbsia betulipollinis]MCY0387224.1 EscU/YscU/HrcU family type III secretion system export apparatus switch protein [Robbsia betulipollinis]
MSEKTEKPTEKKRRDSEQKGQSFKAGDIGTILLLLAGGAAIPLMFHLDRVGDAFSHIAESARDRTLPDPFSYVNALGWLVVKGIAAFLTVCSVVTVVPGLIQSRFTLAFDAIKFNFDALNPANGFKKLFSLRVAKDFCKTLLYIVTTLAGAAIFIRLHYRELFMTARMPEPALRFELAHLARCLGLYLAGAALPVAVLDCLAEYFLYIRSLKMARHEVKQEVKQSQGNPEVKSRQRQLSREGLSEKVKENVKGSTFILANPTHIAVGIYIDFAVTPFPMVSVREVDALAREAIDYAMQCGVPVLRDVPLARRVYARSQRYQFVAPEDLEPIIRILTWLRQVEAAGAPEQRPAGDAGTAEGAADPPASPDETRPTDQRNSS